MIPKKRVRFLFMSGMAVGAFGQEPDMKAYLTLLKAGEPRWSCSGERSSSGKSSRHSRSSKRPPFDKPDTPAHSVT